MLGGHPAFQSIEQAQNIIGTLMVLHNNANRQLRGEDKFQFLLWEGDDISNIKYCKEKTIADWCKGYLAATKLDSLWCSDAKAIAMLFPFGVLANQIDLNN